jgi:hypothetical protein
MEIVVRMATSAATTAPRAVLAPRGTSRTTVAGSGARARRAADDHARCNLQHAAGQSQHGEGAVRAKVGDQREEVVECLLVVERSRRL